MTFLATQGLEIDAAVVTVLLFIGVGVPVLLLSLEIVIHYLQLVKLSRADRTYHVVREEVLQEGRASQSELFMSHYKNRIM